MRIDRRLIDQLQGPRDPREIGPTPAEGTPAAPAAPTPAAARTDRVEISEAGRALAARQGAAPAPGLTPERLAELREKVLSGAYDASDVVASVARRLLASGDL